MAKAMYIGVDGKARKIKKVYIGVDNKARKIKKMYLGVNGKARLIFASEPSVSYFKTAENLSVGRYRLAATTFGNYALFAGGRITQGTEVGNYTSAVDAYDASLVHTNPTSLRSGRQYIGAACVGNYALFAGGELGSSYSQLIDTYDRSLTSSWKYLSGSRSSMGATSVGNYALFAGGSVNYDYNVLSLVDVFDSSLTRTAAEALSISRRLLTGSNIGNLAIFAGGRNSNGTAIANVDIYNNALTHSYTELPSPASELAGAKTDDYALFGGGWTTGSVNANIYSYNRSGVRGAAASLSKARVTAAASANGAALFGGGGDGYVYNTVDVVDNSLTVKTLSRGLSEANSGGAGASVGNYALFAGGSMYTGAFVDVYKVE